jgi:hypothetical protein
MSESDATTQGQSAPPTEDQLQDRIIADAIGYTRGLVSVLDSLTEGFRRRGRELEEHKQRLAILQSERRAVLEERAGLEAQLRSLTPERDGLRTNLEERTREVTRLRQELATSRETLEANARELQRLQTALATATRQAEELRVLQAERGARQDELARLETDLQSMTVERELLRSILDDMERERDRVRQDHASARATLEANTRELQQLQAALATATRQAEELRQIVRRLERDNESKAQQIQRLGEAQRELLQARESAGVDQDAHVMIRERLTNTEQLLDTARKQLSTSQQEMQGLKTSLDEERTLTAALQEQLLSHRQDLSRLATLAQVFSMTLTELAGILGIPIHLADAGQQPDGGAAQLQGLLQAVRGQAGALTESEKQIASLNALVESSREILGTKEALERQLQESGLERQRLQEELAGSVARAEQAREEAHRLSERVNWLTAELEAQSAAAGRLQGAPMAVPEYSAEPAIPLTFPAAQTVETAPEGQPAVEWGPAISAELIGEPVIPALETAPTIPEGSSPPASPELKEPEAPPTGYWVECRIEGASEDTSGLFRGQPSRINEVGVVVPFETSLPTGRVLIVRVIRGREEFSVRGSVVRAQPSKGTGGRKTGSFDHLIRFHHSNLDSSRRLKAFLT